MKVMTKKLGPAKNLNETQQAHALNRLNSIYQEAVRPLQQRSQGRHLNWRNTKDVAAFVKKYKIPEMTWSECGPLIMGVSSFTGPIRDKIQVALNQYFLDSVKDSSAQMAQASLRLAQAQDEIIFRNPEPEEVRDLLTNFKKEIKGLLT